MCRAILINTAILVFILLQTMNMNRIAMLALILLTPFQTAKSKDKMTEKEVFERFVAAVNAHDATAMAKLIAPIHSFTDAAGNELKGADTVLGLWKSYFAAFAGYNMAVSQTIIEGNNIAAFGTLSGTIESVKWNTPASWKTTIEDGKVAVFQVFADTRILFDALNHAEYPDNSKPRVTSVGGVFFKCADADKTRAWYKDNLGLNVDKYGTTFEWRQVSDPALMGYTQWSPFKSTTKYFEPSTKDFMINYRVVKLEALVENLKKAGVTITDKIESFEYGKFVHIMDCDGNKIELWEPNDEEYGKILNVKSY